MDRLERLGQELVERLTAQAEAAGAQGPASASAGQQEAVGLRPQGCLTSGQLEDLVRGRVDDQAAGRVTAHLDTCLACLNTFVEMRDSFDGLAAPPRASRALRARLRQLTGSRERRPSTVGLAAAIGHAFSFRIPAVWTGAVAAVVALITWFVLVPIHDASMHAPTVSLPSTLPPAMLTGLTGDGCTSSVPTSASRAQTMVSTGSTRGRGLPKLVEELQNGVVVVIGLDKGSKPLQCGSGFFINRNGSLLTSYHLIKDAGAVSVKMTNGAFFPLEQVIAIDARQDLAVLKVAGQNLPALKLGDSDTVQVGEEVIALGTPLGLEASVSTGVISGIRHDADRALFQTTAPTSSGSSGGPLLNVKGEVIGIIMSSARDGQNLNFAIPINAAKAAEGRAAPRSNAEKALNAYFAGVLYTNSKDYQRATESFLKATALDPTNADAWLELGTSYYYTGEREKEGAAYKKAIALRPTNDDAHFLLGTWYEDREQFDAAAQEFRETIRLDPKNEGALYELALLELSRGHRAEATQTYEQLRPLNRGLALKLRRILELSDRGGGVGVRDKP